MRRLVAAALAVVGASGCTTFDFAAPVDDASADTTLDAGDASTVSLLTVAQAAQLCALVFQCDRLGEAIEGSLVIPVATPSAPLNYSSCMDWLAGPIDPNRVGLAHQRTILANIAASTSCSAAYLASPVQPVEAGAACPASSCAGVAVLETCSADGGAFTAACGPPLLAQAEQCTPTDDAGSAVCATLGECVVGLTCSADSADLVECYAKGPVSTSYDCTLSGRQCAPLSMKVPLADCVSPGRNTAPCPLRQTADSCDGTSVLHCAGGLLAQTEFDCGPVGRVCGTPGGPARCVGMHDTCTPFDSTVNQCTGTEMTTITLCIGGSPRSFDCSTLGKACVLDTTNKAHCG